MKGIHMEKDNTRKDTYKKLSCEVTRELAAKVDRESHRLCITKSEYIRRALRKYLDD